MDKAVARTRVAAGRGGLGKGGGLVGHAMQAVEGDLLLAFCYFLLLSLQRVGARAQRMPLEWQ